ncbi:hypothetical protein B0H14DRAFT_3454014 [Mycena olivaceomarginata]|nr:hypothetical protein B0H14DRAFT_3454014 [Mycena olivaceomarginata]
MSTPLPAQTAHPARSEALPPPGAPNSRISPSPDAPTPSPRLDAPAQSPCPDVPTSPTPPHPDAPPPPPALITARKEKRPRHHKGQPKAKPGRVAWVHGTKLSFFARRKEDWLREAEAKRSGAFYIKMSKLYVKKYG